VVQEAAPVTGEHAKDRRVQKTQRLLRDALVSLIHEKSYDSIAVKEILNRANVGRSAFYAHFHDKHALLASGIHQMLREGARRPLPPGAKRFRNIVWFSFPVFEYVNPFRHTDGSLMAREGHTIIHEHLRQVLIDTIADELRASVPQPKSGAGSVPPELLALYVAGTFVLVLNWWVESKNTLSPREVDDMFLSMVLPTLTAMTECA
jgi:AcrR family transcriptional regulator